MALHFLAVVCLLVHLYAPALVFATSSCDLYNDSACKNLYANVQTGTNAGDGECGLLNGVYSVSATSLDSGCYLTIYSDDCSSNATAARIGTCTTLEGFLQIASYSVDCPGNNGPLEDYTTSFAAAAQTTTKPPTLSESTSSQERPQDSTTSTQSPSFSESTSSSQEPQALPTTSQSPSSSSTSPTSSTSSSPSLKLSSSTPGDVQPTPTPASASPTIATSPLSTRLPSSSSSSTQSSTPSSSPSQTPLGNSNKGGLSKHDDIIIIGVIVPVCGLCLMGLGFLIYRKLKQRGVLNQTSRHGPEATENAATPGPDINHSHPRRISGSTMHESSRDSGSGVNNMDRWLRESGDHLMAGTRTNSGDFSSQPTAPQEHMSFPSAR